MAAAPWEHLGEQRTEEVIRIGKVMSRTVLEERAPSPRRRLPRA